MPEQIISGSGPQHPLVVNADGTITFRDGITLQYIQKLDFESGTSPVYIGFAAPGTGNGSPAWLIKKHVNNGNGMTIEMLFASGNTNFDKVWDSRSGTNAAYS